MDVLLQMLLALGGVVLLIYGIAYVLKKRQKKAGLINILDYVSFGPKKGIAAVKVGAEVLIVGVTPTDFRLLTTLTGKNPLNLDEEGRYEQQRI
ncbi:MAG: flagellar biosynthetic protein FliO [Nitrospirae bacterium]|nr:flagellar biosynthetic protein FliO [Nitrospirota bacterium]MBF0590617.1 flagellar biosynthetic protein FliO [Nitrospirota bacterium]